MPIPPTSGATVLGDITILSRSATLPKIGEYSIQNKSMKVVTNFGVWKKAEKKALRRSFSNLQSTCKETSMHATDH